jgi:hypothetical protein
MDRRNRKFADQYHAMAKELAEFRAGEAARGAATEQVVKKAVAAAIAPRDADLRELYAEVARLKQLVIKKDVIIERARIGFMTIGEAFDVECAAHAATCIERDDWRKRSEDTQPTIDAAKAAVVELKGLLDRVNNRMRKREIEEAAAIANRRIFAGAVPGGRR